MIDLSISIITINKKLIQDCLDSIFATVKELNIEIFVIVNACPDAKEIEEHLRENFPAVVVIVNKKEKGFSTNHNIAIRKCSGKYVLILNDDTIILEDALEKMYHYMEEHSSIGVLGCKILNPDHTLQWSCGKSFNKKFEFFKSGLLRTLFAPVIRDQFFENTQEVNWVTGACMMVRAETIKDVGPFDENIYMYFDDGDWCFRIKDSGWEIFYYNDAKIIHLRSETSKNKLEKTTSIYFKSRLYFFSKHYSDLSLLLVRWLTVVDAVVQSLKVFIMPSRGTNNKYNLIYSYIGAIKLAITFKKAV